MGSPGRVPVRKILPERHPLSKIDRFTPRRPGVPRLGFLTGIPGAPELGVRELRPDLELVPGRRVVLLEELGVLLWDRLGPSPRPLPSTQPQRSIHRPPPHSRVADGASVASGPVGGQARGQACNEDQREEASSRQLRSTRGLQG